MSIGGGQQRFHIPLDEIQKEKDGEVLVDHWWAVHPEEGVAFVKTGRHVAPQCNRDKRIADRITPKYHPGHDVVLIPIAYLGHVRS